MKQLFTLLTLTILVMAGCVETKVQEDVVVLSEQGLNASHLLADTIVYSVDLVNTDSLDTWSDWRLRNMNTSKLVEEVFDNVYSGRLQAYDYFTDAALTVEDVRNLEVTPNYARSLIEEIQFEETWLFSPELQIFHKEVHSFVLAYALYAQNGERMGLKPVFRVRLEN